MGRKEDIQALIKANERRLQVRKEQAARLGISVEPSIVIEIADIEESVAQLKIEFAQLDDTSNSEVSFDKLSTKEQQYQLALHWAEDGRKQSLTRFDLSECDLRAVNLSRADLRVANLSGANLRRADLRKCNFTMADLSGADLQNADLTGANLEEADLINANFFRTNFQDVMIDDMTRISSKWRLVWRIVNQGGKGLNFGHTDISGANLTGVDLYEVNLFKANLSGVDFTRANLEGADIRNADLYEATLEWTNLCYANLNGADLSGASLIGADLKGADFRNADLLAVDFYNARCNSTTRWPDGFTLPANTINEDTWDNFLPINLDSIANSRLDIDHYLDPPIGKRIFKDVPFVLKGGEQGIFNFNSSMQNISSNESVSLQLDRMIKAQAV